MGREWDGADGFRRSLNAADTGRESVFGRTSRTSPEYRTSAAKAGMAKPGIGERETGWPSFLGGLNPKCRACGRWQRGANPCQCETPDFPNERLPRLHTYQAWCEAWAAECLRVLKPGGHLLAFGGSRTYHRLTCAIEDAGFEIRDAIQYLYGTGFPKALSVQKAIEKAQRGTPQGAADPTSPNHGQYRTTKTEGRRWEGDKGQSYGAGGSRFLTTTVSERTTALSTLATTDRTAVAADDLPLSTPGATATSDAQRWAGWATALKPAYESIVVARKPLAGTVAANVVAFGTGALNIDGCRVETGDALVRPAVMRNNNTVLGSGLGAGVQVEPPGRWPTNVVLSHVPLLDDAGIVAGDACADGCVKGCPVAELDRQSGTLTSGAWRGVVNKARGNVAKGAEAERVRDDRDADTGGASRFFPVFRYEAKADSNERPRIKRRVLRLRSDLTPEQVDFVTARLREAGVAVD